MKRLEDIDFRKTYGDVPESFQHRVQYALRRTEEAIQAALAEVQTSRTQFRSASQEQMQAAQDHLKQQETPPQKSAENK